MGRTRAVSPAQATWYAASDAAAGSEADTAECPDAAKGSRASGDGKADEIAADFSRLLDRQRIGGSDVVLAQCSPAQWADVVSRMGTQKQFTNRTVHHTGEASPQEAMAREIEAAKQCGEAAAVVLEGLESVGSADAGRVAGNLNMQRGHVTGAGGTVVILVSQALFRALGHSPHLFSQAVRYRCD